MKTNLISKLLVTGACAALIFGLAACGDGGNGNGEGTDQSTGNPGGGNEVAAGEVALTTEFPPEQIEGTPMPVKLPNLVQAPKQAPTTGVPEGTVLVSQGKPVTGSDDFPVIGDMDLIVDGEKLGGEGYYVEFIGGSPQWIQIDLEETMPVEAVWVWHFHSQARAYHDVIVQVSDDENFEENVTTVFNNDYDNSAGMGEGEDAPYVESRFGKLIDVDGVEARYVRLYASGNTSSDSIHYIEVEVYGRPAAGATDSADASSADTDETGA
jgi:hypothetical protein